MDVDINLEDLDLVSVGVNSEVPSVISDELSSGTNLNLEGNSLGDLVVGIDAADTR